MANKPIITRGGSRNRSGNFKPMKTTVQHAAAKKIVYKTGDRDLKRDAIHRAPPPKNGFSYGHTLWNGTTSRGKATAIINLRGKG